MLMYTGAAGFQIAAAAWAVGGTHVHPYTSEGQQWRRPPCAQGRAALAVMRHLLLPAHGKQGSAASSLLEPARSQTGKRDLLFLVIDARGVALQVPAQLYQW